ncbi:MAG: 2-oxo acid dehydrogenase subunit E2 [Lachnospiraceae bacterium]|nr:2-oxo acid dehydrogenase subunit E2 [Lachnospiraceae bacterium]
MSKEKKLSMLGKSMGKQMTRSWEAPQFTLFSEVDCERLISYRKALPVKMSYTTILIKELSEVIAEYPVINSSWDDGTKLIEHEKVNMGVAVDTKRGLLVPVIREADTKILEEINEAMGVIKSKSAKGNFNIDELSGGTFILSNLGMQNVTAFTAIVNAPNVAILSVGKMKEVPMVKNGEIVIGKTMTIGLNMDHRVVDGATGAKFLTELTDRLEHLGEEKGE